MALTNGNNFIISGDTVTIDASCAPSCISWCYDSTKIEITSAVKYYYNGVFQYTSENYTSGEYYPYLSARSTSGDQWTYTTGTDVIGDFFQWEINFTPAAFSKYHGFNDTTTEEADDISGGMKCSGNGSGIFNQIREDDVEVFTPDPTPTVEDGDTFRIYYTAAAPAGGSNITFPQIPEPKSIKNSAFKS